MIADLCALKFCTTSLLVEVAQYIKFGGLEDALTDDPPPNKVEGNVPTLDINILSDDVEAGSRIQYSTEEEDAALVDTCSNFADWVAAFLQRVILLFENLPEEGSSGGQTEGPYIPLFLYPCQYSPNFLLQKYSTTCRRRL